MQKTYSFTKLQILNAIAHWDLEPFTLEELNFLLKYFNPSDYLDNCSYEYGENDIQSYILEVLSEIDN